MERFSAAVAGDVHRLLTALGSTVELLRRLSGDERINRLVDTADISIRRGEHLVRQLLAYAGAQALRPEPVDVDALLATLQTPWRREAAENVTLRIEPGATASRVLLDPDRLGAALTALLLNARDALGEGGGTVTVSTRRVEEPAGPGGGDPAPFVDVTVADTGRGMSPAVLARACEPFFTTNGESASGLGLSEVQGFARQSAGELAIESTAGLGTAATLRFPAVADGKNNRLPAGRASVLVVEDDEVVRSLVVEMLEAHGFDVDAAENGTVALDRFTAATRHYDVLFTDIVMPDGPNGVELAERAQGVQPDLRILLASGYTRNHLRAQEGLRDGIRFLPKPYRMGQMIAALEALLDTA